MIFRIIFASIVFLSISCNNCNDSIDSDTLPREGAIKIDKIFSKWGTHATTAADRNGNSLLYHNADFPIRPKVGDSLTKRKGELEYTLYSGDSIYVERFDCKAGGGIIVSRRTTRNT